MKKCETCRYGRMYELDKPCIVYREDCPLYEKEGDGMNREEAIKILENERDNHINGCNGVFYETRTEAVNMAIKALEQEPKTDVLDKIRAEIKALSNANPSYWHSGDMVEREEVFDIIDKYKAERDHKCHNCKHYMSGEQDGSCDSYICKGYSDWESDNCN